MFRKLLSFDEAKQLLEQNFFAKPVGVEKVTILEASNRVLARDIIAPLNIPTFSRSVVDGYAVRAADTFGASEDKPVTLRFCGYVVIGESPKVAVKTGLAAEIVTGAPLPDGADSVVMVEYTSQEGDKVSVRRPVSIGENLMAAGSDICKNETVLKSGQFLGYREIGVL
jgi:putative molybdopterin biosynthesis protein